MLKKTVTYTDWNGETVTEDLYFHLSEPDLVELELSAEGGLSESIKKIIESEDGKAIMGEFKKILMLSYGKKSTDGKRFIKNDKLREEFESSKAYAKIFMELVTNADAASDFVNGIVPSNLATTAAEIARASQAASAVDPVAAPVGGDEPEVLTRLQMAEMSAAEFDKIRPKLATGEVKIAD